MELPQKLRAALLAADEEYLTALCNRGTVNRAKKDLASTQPEARGTDGDAVTLAVGDAVCTITAPLGNSICSCPSSAMCRHRMAAILWLKEQSAQTAPPPGETAAPAADAPPEETAEELAALLSAYPTQTLTRQLGERRVSALIQRERLGPGASIREGSTVTVDLPWSPATVRLIAPLEHSSCTCHSRSFCLHKAEALLIWQLRHGVVTADALLSAPDAAGQDGAGRRAVCAAVQDAMTDWLRTGLSRLPPSSQDAAERLAGLCHTGGLPTLERAMRRLHGELQRYFGRSAAFRPELLLRRMGDAWRLAGALQTAEGLRVLELAGVFREEYLPVGDLRLYLLGLQEVDLASGYAGTVYYFWETQQQRYYTYRDLRPKFYDARRQPGPAETILWALPGTLRQMWNCRLDLHDARATAAGALSSTAQCRGTLLKKSPPGEIIPAEAVTEDFSLLLPSSRTGRPEPERLAILRPARWEAQEYDPVEQIFSLRLLDREDRDIWVTVRYREQEKAVVEVLEGLVQEKTPASAGLPVFFGSLWRENGRLCLYPIECFTNWEGTP